MHPVPRNCIDGAALFLCCIAELPAVCITLQATEVSEVLPSAIVLVYVPIVAEPPAAYTGLAAIYGLLLQQLRLKALLSPSLHVCAAVLQLQRRLRSIPGQQQFTACCCSSCDSMHGTSCCHR
jgi:hypothetical protein